ncbi:heterokaryon incompatibility protein-domain-containing protein [Paraphoma chrysanthemicola]|nr:heterokaryon incompatibility protein-domain-containing protein [Paraphoma chrysanthemicola]
MHLLNTSSLQLEEFIAGPPRYAILSHTWEDEEVLFKDIHDLTKASSKKGYKKIHTCCKLAKSEGYQYVWVDTCCIDKSSSAELSEAINSMFAYYMNSGVCYVYLDKHFPNVASEGLRPYDLRGTRWVTRGWTLQELVAPHCVKFYDKQWQFCGTRNDLLQQLTEATNINMQELKEFRFHRSNMVNFSVAQRMSWASQRQTTRPEDIAYCLFGIFDVHMPPLYGEGAEKAFLRLQEEIIKRSTDSSILSWSSYGALRPEVAALALSPLGFSSCQHIRNDRTLISPFKVTSRGLRVKLPIVQYREYGNGERTCMAILPNCAYSESMLGSDKGTPLIALRLHSFELDSDDWYRRDVSFTARANGTWVPEDLVDRSELQNATVCKIYIR